MIFKWGDASNITLSSSFDNFSFHGDTTFPIKMQSMQMHITVKCVEEVQSTNHALMEAAGGGKRRLPAQKGSRTWLEQRWFSRSRRPHPSLKTINATDLCVSLDSFCSGGRFSVLFVSTAIFVVFMCVCKRSLAGLVPALLRRAAPLWWGHAGWGNNAIPELMSKHADFSVVAVSFLSHRQPPQSSVVIFFFFAAQLQSSKFFIFICLRRS